MRKMKQQPKVNWKQLGGFFGLGILTGLMLLVGTARLVWHGKYYPGVRVGGALVAGLTREQAKVKIENAVADYQIILSFNGVEWVSPAGMLPVETDRVLTEAYRYGRRLQMADYLLLLINKKTDYPLSLPSEAGAAVEEWLSTIAPVVELPPTEPVVAINNKKVIVTNGTDGTMIDRAKLSDQLGRRVSSLDETPIEIPIMVTNMQLNGEQLEALRGRGEKLVGTKLTLVLDDERILLSDAELVTFVYTGRDEWSVESSRIEEYIQGLTEALNREPQDAKFVFENGRVSEFAPGRDGLKVSVEQTADAMQQGIEKLLAGENKVETVQVTAVRTPPKITTDKVNDLGIVERIGRGESYYAHSIANRVYNVGLASSRVSGALVAPGEEFSFNKYVGEISGATGYKTAYVISGGRTVLGDGGGVCQVSTTLFRAAMNAGLPITERWAHAYRVGYYEQNSEPGIDATVYSPSKDFKFRNDTPGHILVQAINDPKNLHLVFEIYGAGDGRTATVSKPKVWGVSPPPPSIYQDDPSLPVGVTKQVDWAAWGARTSFEYKVVRNGETLQDKTFTSAYRPWANVYLRGTGQ